MRINDGNGIRKGLLTLVVIGHNNVDSKGSCKLDLTDSGNTGVNGNDKPRSPFRKLQKSRFGNTVALADAIRNVIINDCAVRAQI